VWHVEPNLICSLLIPQTLSHWHINQSPLPYNRNMSTLPTTPLTTFPLRSQRHIEKCLPTLFYLPTHSYLPLVSIYTPLPNWSPRKESFFKMEGFNSRGAPIWEENNILFPPRAGINMAPKGLGNTRLSSLSFASTSHVESSNCWKGDRQTKVPCTNTYIKSF